MMQLIESWRLVELFWSQEIVVITDYPELMLIHCFKRVEIIIIYQGIDSFNISMYRFLYQCQYWNCSDTFAWEESGQQSHLIFNTFWSRYDSIWRWKNTGCPKKKYQLGKMTTTPLFLSLFSLPITVLKTSGSKEFKTALTFKNW